MAETWLEAGVSHPRSDGRVLHRRFDAGAEPPHLSPVLGLTGGVLEPIRGHEDLLRVGIVNLRR